MSVLNFLQYLRTLGKSYSVINTNKSMLMQTLKLMGNHWCDSPRFIPRFMKGLFNSIPPVPRYVQSWDVSYVVEYLKTLFPLESLDLKTLTLKLVALVSLSLAPRAQTLVALNLEDMNIYDNQVIFGVKTLLKTSKPGKIVNICIPHFEKEELCPMHTLLYYIEKTKNLRKCHQLLVSYVTHKSVSTKSVARWLKEVLSSSGIDTGIFKAHSFRGAAASAAFSRGCSLTEILKTGDWSSVRNFKKYYLRPEPAKDSNFANSVLSQ